MFWQVVFQECVELRLGWRDYQRALGEVDRGGDECVGFAVIAASAREEEQPASGAVGLPACRHG